MAKIKTLLTHIFVWLAYVTIAISAYGYKKSNLEDYIYEIFFSYLQSALLFYAIVFIPLKKYWSQKKYITSVILILVIVAISIGSRFLFAYVISIKLFGVKVSALSLAIDEQMLAYLNQTATFLIAASLFWYKDSRAQLEKELAKQITENADREKLELELDVLRAQINPHFLMNSLDILRQESAKTDPNVSQGITWFMKVLDAGICPPDPDGKVPLEVETDAILGIINIYERRFHDLQVDCKIEIVDSENLRIQPHVLLPFVENAFKYGDYRDANQRLEIHLEVKDAQIKLHVFNKKSDRKIHNSNGIGLKYVKRHLESGYPDKHDIKIDETEETYSVNLSINVC